MDSDQLPRIKLLLRMFLWHAVINCMIYTTLPLYAILQYSKNRKVQDINQDIFQLVDPVRTAKMYQKWRDKNS